MRVRPILFNTDMVRAILDGRKTVTRRKVKFFKNRNPAWTGYMRDGFMLYNRLNGLNVPCCKMPPYQKGDIVYVRETWQHLYELDGNEEIIEGTGKYYYAATDVIPFDSYIDSKGERYEKTPWKPSIHMPKEAARIWLRVTNVRVERLHDMTLDDFLSEGVCLNPEAFNDPENAYGQASL